MAISPTSIILLMAKKARDKYNAEVIFIPNKNSPWKGIGTSPEDKKAMVELAIKNIPNFSFSSYELEKETNYTIDTVKHYKNLYPNDNLFLLIGSDQANLFYKWKDAEEIIKYVTLICYKRLDIPLDKNMVEKFKISIIEGEEKDSASTEIRSLKVVDTNIDVLDYIHKHKLYYMNEIEKYIDGERLEHSCSVALLSYQIALSNHLEKPSKAYIAGLLHDIGKNVTPEQIKEIEERFSMYLPIDRKIYHQFVSRLIAERDFGISDDDILEAIQFHTTGKGNMSTLAKIVYAADKIEPLRELHKDKEIETCLKDINEGFMMVLKETKDYLIEAKKDFGNKATTECFNYYLK